MTSPAAEVIARIRAAGANILLDNDRLKLVNGKKLTPENLDCVKRHAREIASFLADEASLDERAAIIEHDGGLPKRDAERLARLLLAKPPRGADRADWSWFVGHAVQIMDGLGETRAAS